MHIKYELEDMASMLEPETDLNAIRAQKKQEYENQIIGNMAGYAICDDIPIDHVIEELSKRVAKALLERSMRRDSPFWKSYHKTTDRLYF